MTSGLQRLEWYWSYAYAGQTKQRVGKVWRFGCDRTVANLFQKDFRNGPRLDPHRLLANSIVIHDESVEDITGRDVLWHSAGSITDHYTMGQIREIHEALEKIAKPSSNWNLSLESLKSQAAERRARGLPKGPAATG